MQDSEDTGKGNTYNQGAQVIGYRRHGAQVMGYADMGGLGFKAREYGIQGQRDTRH